MTKILQQQVSELTAVYKGLKSVTEQVTGTVVLSGTLLFKASFTGLETITDSFNIELTIPSNFPDDLPMVRETGGRIDAGYNHLLRDGTLCLSVPIEQRRILLKDPTLLSFVNRLLIPYFYGYCFFKEHGHHPFGEAVHSSEAIVNYYVDTLGLNDQLTALKLISFLFEHGYRSRYDCPCGSGRRVRNCHGADLLEIYNAHNKQSLREDFLTIFKTCFDKFEKAQISFSAPLCMQLLRLLKKV